MKLKTKQFGEIEFSDDLILNFKEGLVGFETLRKFILIKPEDTLFYWLNSVENPDIAFPLFGLRLIDEEYPQIENHEAFGIVILNPDPLKITVNMKAPVYINQDNKTGYQKILDDEKYSLYYNLFTE
ncbi:flagellar assembly protein FliW [Melioribacter roseus P3M-2]|uniref:Flagellar assembly protein FliW n=1 Tax=Melioribacter roseus (strain DSM 23840 / JCM 17771 / VKM B-2668 / P3M-2) TaxID=1191523 RepID=I7A6B0_MELRP|nr:flagellar assembly protein FliW [Melioribacter roseus]AFN75396.1 flagellar assembly protein FliW [Melioribacter roseus P3M-2]